MRTRFSSHLSPRTARPVSAEFAPTEGAQTRNPWSAARRLTLALVASAPLCAGALLAGPAQAAPTVESDENGPLVQIIKPGYNDILKGKYRILIQVTARKYNPQSVEMFIDDVSATPGPLEISSFASSSYDFDTRLLKEGRHKLTVRVTDSQGFRGWSEVTVFVNNQGAVDTQAPDLRWVGIEPFQELTGSIKLEVNAADDFGVKILQISINPADTPNKPAFSWFMNQPPYKVNLDTIGKNIPDGLYVLKALAWDSLEQQGEAAPLTFGIVNNQINATRVQDMLDGQRQMQKVLAGEKLDAPAKSAEARANSAAASDKPLAATTAKQIAPATEKPAEVLAAPAPKTAVPEEAASARSSASAIQSRPVAPLATAPGAASAPQPRMAPPSLNIAPPALNPGIQLPRVPLAALPAPDAAPRLVPQIATDSKSVEAATIAPETRAQAATAETFAPTESAAESAPVAPTQAAPTQAATATETIEIAPPRREELSEQTRIAMNQSRPASQRNGGEATLSRAAAIELAVAAPSGALIANARGGVPIDVARFSQPSLTGRNITDMPVMSQSVSEEARLSNAELSRLRSNKTRVLSAARPLVATALETTSARALQTSAPTLAPRPILGRAVTADSLRTPAPKLTREAQKSALAANQGGKPALSGSLSKTVLAGERLAPVAPLTPAQNVAPRSAVSKVVATPQRALPIEIAPMKVAKNSAPASAPQMSAPNAPRMSESASGLGVPERAAPKSATIAAKTTSNTRVAALPRPGAVTSNRGGATIVAVPLNTPLELAASNALPVPTSYKAERNTTLRAVAARYGLPVELVAISNNTTIDARIAMGTEVKLPRPLQVSYNGSPVTGDAPSMLMGDTAVTAFRFMFEKTGGKMEWDAVNQRVVASKDGREITLTIGSNVAKVGEREVMMEIAAFLFQGRTMVPLRFFEEGLNAQVEWNPQTGRIVVAMAG